MWNKVMKWRWNCFGHKKTAFNRRGVVSCGTLTLAGKWHSGQLWKTLKDKYEIQICFTSCCLPELHCAPSAPTQPSIFYACCRSAPGLRWNQVLLLSLLICTSQPPSLCYRLTEGPQGPYISSTHTHLLSPSEPIKRLLREWITVSTSFKDT